MENAWQDFFPKFESGEDWQESLNNYTQKLRHQVEYTEKLRHQVEELLMGTLKNSQDPAELWQIYIQEMQKFNQLWVDGLGASIESLGKPEKMSASQPWIELNNLYWNLMYEKTLGSLTQIPLWGQSRSFNQKLMKAFDAWEKLYPTSINYQIVLTEIQLQSFEELMQEMISLAETGEKVKDWQQFQQLWCRTADKVFEKAFCSEDNLKVRGKFLNAMNQHKLCQQELMEVWMKMMNMPIRSEVDEVHKSIYELRKEVKNLKKTLAKYEAQAQTISQDSEEIPTQTSD
ncbi:class III poly(R)-hydroxyalkanoic acid synthase subunit PhaE [Crocosphaera sp. XPORK-15E]|uniref:class III poly(R)-hydroxyalkanoic acid synthase subunit PhaE n=1 Tax=Crocosphaera sp. XPORK-15E TaxID=3110247 RepID=UPI002B210B5B|nr:class III poly(R)-hydroxyalkanoic acid synthase subunit PhaE [Crocosphaera sp. XPORK-15E]MEA5534424.1 class III poly(R)-hydroxyalkanoic acid synthase subunit PhaE [Crocosphaera sp. XPORK-15E]